MSWKRHFRVIKGQQQAVPNPLDANRWGGSGSINSNLASYLPLVYAGHPNRIQRYYQFDDMDRDSDINAALDTIADFCTQSEEQSDQPFEIHYNSDPNQSETKIIKTMLDKWVKLNTFRSRLWYMFRDTLKNGDAFYLRDPETQEWLWLDHFMVEMVKVDDTMGKKPDEYLIRGLDYNRQAHYGTKKADPNQYRTPYGTSNIGAARATAVSASSGPAAFSMAGTAVDPRQRHMMGPFAQEVSVVDAQFVVHLSLSIGNDINWPFGPSILEPIFKTFKQKELLEDAIIIYRVQRAPERRIFYIDTGTMPPERAKRHIESIKNDIHQRRIPNRNGTGGGVLDAAYNPLCFDLATRIPLLDGRTVTLSELIDEHEAGKENWVYSCDPVNGEIMPGNITWAGVTRKNTEVIRITLDNGETFICTPDHKIPVLGRGFVEAKDLTPDDSLIALYTRGELQNERTYTQVYDHDKREWVYVHRMVGEFFRTRNAHEEFTFLPEALSAIKNVIHHKDYNRYNNNPRIAKTEHVGAMDVGTITVDGKEQWQNHHTFAIDAGIFVKNSINDDYFFAQSQDGRGSKVETLPGGEQTGEITDLMFFSRKLARGLRVPVSYLNLGEDEGGSNVTFQDGKLGAAMIQEYRFSKFCMRLQSLLAPIFDKEFKRYMMKNGVEMDWPMFELRFTPPQNFTKYRQIELDAQRMQVYQGVAENRRLSERFKLTRYLGLSEDELLENEKLWSEENAAKLKQKTGASPAESQPGADLGAVGIRSGDSGLPPDLEMPPDEAGDQAGGPNLPGGPQAGGPPGGPAAPDSGPGAGGGGGAMGGAGPGM